MRSEASNKTDQFTKCISEYLDPEQTNEHSQVARFMGATWVLSAPGGPQVGPT